MSISEIFNSGVAVVTGSGSGIGKALVEQLATCGMTVVIAEYSRERGEKVAKDINEAGGKATFIQTDVSKRESVKALADSVFKDYGEVKLLINNAGISVMGKIWEISDDTWDRAIDVNIRGTIAGLQYFLPPMIESGKPAYVCNLGSLASFSMDTNQSAYFSLKHAILSLSESLFLEMQEGEHPIQVSVAAPGIIATRIFKDSIKTQAGSELAAAMQHVTDHQGMPAKEAANIILQGIADQKFLISTHPEFTQMLAAERARYLTSIETTKPVCSDPGAFLEPS